MSDGNGIPMFDTEQIEKVVKSLATVANAICAQSQTSARTLHRDSRLGRSKFQWWWRMLTNQTMLAQDRPKPLEQLLAIVEAVKVRLSTIGNDICDEKMFIPEHQIGLHQFRLICEDCTEQKLKMSRPHPQQTWITTNGVSPGKTGLSC